MRAIARLAGVALAVVLTACAPSHELYHKPIYFPFTVSKRHPVNKEAGVRLLSVSKNGTVKVRDGTKTMTASIFPGASYAQRIFVTSRGWYSDLILDSIDKRTGEVHISREGRAYYSY